MFLAATGFIFFASCTDNNPAPVISFPDQSFTEEFENLNEAETKGWRFINTSVEPGPTNWMNPETPPFSPFSSSGSNGYIWANYNSTSSASGTISNWAVSPRIGIRNGDRISFYTRAEIVLNRDDSTDFVNRMQVRLNKHNDGLNVGNGGSTGDFSLLLLDINPDYNEFLYKKFLARSPSALNAYPHRWTRFEVTVSDVDTPVYGRFAFRYFVEVAGNNGRATSIGIDRVEYQSVK